MRVFSTLFSLSLLLGAALAKKKRLEHHEDFHQQQSQSITPLKLDDAAYNYLTAIPRDYSAAVLLTALEPKFGCQLCREFEPEWDLLGRSWIRGDKAGDSRLLFGTLDFAHGRDIFISLGLQTAPVLLLFQPTTGPFAVASPEPLRLDFTAGSLSAEQVHSWLSRHLPNRPHPAVKRPFNWFRWASTIIIVLGVGTAVVSASSFVLPIIQNRNLWASLSLIFILLFTSGHMFNHIRKVPYVEGNGNGGFRYISPGFQGQLGLETQIVAAVYGVLSFCAISLAVKVPRIADPKSQKVAAIIWGGVIFFTYSFLLSVFRLKNGGYPLSLPPFM